MCVKSLAQCLTNCNYSINIRYYYHNLLLHIVQIYNMILTTYYSYFVMFLSSELEDTIIT